MYLYGASGHAKVIIEILEARGIKVEGLFDDNESVQNLLGYQVHKWNAEADGNKKMIISIGTNSIRKRIVDSINGEFERAIHPKSILSKRSIIGVGTVIMGGVTINVNASVGKHCIVNTNASIDHDCVLDDFVHISPNVALCGNVYVSEGTHVGAGSVVIPGKKIGKWCVIGAGSVVINDIPDYSIAVGNPCKVIKNPISN